DGISTGSLRAPMMCSTCTPAAVTAFAAPAMARLMEREAWDGPKANRGGGGLRGAGHGQVDGAGAMGCPEDEQSRPVRVEAEVQPRLVAAPRAVKVGDGRPQRHTDDAGIAQQPRGPRLVREAHGDMAREAQ